MSQLLVARSAAGRWLLTAAVLGSGMVMLDGTVVNIALREIGGQLDASIADLQWIVDAYLLSLASLILVGGSLGDRFGRRRIFLVGVIWFAAASALCAVAQDPWQLITARLVQGVGGALLTPGSLALIQSSIRQEDRGRAIGRWAGLTGVAFAVGPLVGGWIVQVASWRWIFGINLPIALVVAVLTVRHVPESNDPGASRDFDEPGAVLGVVGLAGVTFALVEAGSTAATGAGVVGVAAMVAFVLRERSARCPMVPPMLFADRIFVIANLITLLIYGALASMQLFLVLQLQVATGWSPLAAGLATLPVTALMLVFSGVSGELASRLGPRWQLAGGPLVAGLGVWLLRGVGSDTAYLTGVLPGVVIFGVGLTSLVAPLTASVLAAAADRYAGLASGINNAIARTGSLLAVAALPALVGIDGRAYLDPALLTDGYRTAQLIASALLVGGGLIAWLGLPSNRILAAAVRD